MRRLLCIISTLLVLSESAKVLFLPSTLYPVHPYTMSFLARELVKREHQVTWLEYGPKESSVKLPQAVERLFWKTSFENQQFSDIFEHRNHSVYTKVWDNEYEDENQRTTAWLAGTRLCDRVLSTQKKAFDELVSTRFDTVIVDDLYNPCGLLVAGLKKAVFIYWSLTGLRTESAWANQSPSPPSYLPVAGTKLTDELTFTQRSYNLASYLKQLYIHQHIVQPRIDAVFQKFYPGIEPAFDLERNASINFVNHPPIFDFARPYMPRVNFVGGLHCRNASEIRGQLGVFVDEPESKGFMLVTGGFSTNWATAPAFVRDTLISAFQASSDVRFVWQYNGPTIENLPVNVHVAAWLPQQDLLGHPKCLGHISHGGLNSVIESVWHGVPVIGLPFTAFNYDNLLRVTARGAGIMLPKQKLQLKSLKRAIKQIQEKRYSDEMAVFQDMVRDVPYSELTHAAFWVEFIDRHQEVPHARSGADKLNVLQYFLVDVILFLFSVLFIVFATIFYIVRAFFRGLLRLLGFSKTKNPINITKKRN